jgi:hypothetical protein
MSCNWSVLPFATNLRQRQPEIRIFRMTSKDVDMKDGI